MGRWQQGEWGVVEGLWEGNWDREMASMKVIGGGLQYFYKNAALTWNPNISFFLDKVLIHIGMRLGQ